MREWQRCPRCGFFKAGICPPCFPAEAEQERQQELAEILAAEADEQRRLEGQIYCHEHERHDTCIRKRSVEEVRAILGRPEPKPARRMTWRQAFDQLMERYVP